MPINDSCCVDGSTLVCVNLDVVASKEQLPEIIQPDVDVSAVFRERKSYEKESFGLPFDDFFNQLVVQRFLRLVMFRHLLKDFWFPAPKAIR